MLTPDEREIIYFSLSLRAGLIETGDPFMRARDAEDSGQKDMIRALSLDQMRLLLSIDNLMERVANNKL